jgi:hypothetical protein
MIEPARVDGAVLRKSAGGANDRLVDQAGERHHAEAAAHPAEGVAPRQRVP